MTAREDLYGLISRLAMTDSADWHDDVQKRIDAFRAEVLAEARTTWPSAADLQQAAAAKRASGNPEDVAVANLLTAIANALAWLAPYRANEGGYEMWGAASTLAQLINGTPEPAPDFFQPGRTYIATGFPEYGWRFRCDSITTHPEDGERTAIGWRHFHGQWDPYAYGEGDWDIHQAVGIVKADAMQADVPDDRCQACGCIDPDCTSCTNGHCRDDSDEWVHCSAPHCPNGERHAKATERGWTNDHNDTWLCPSHPLGGAA